MSSGDVEIVHGIFCENVRAEQTGQISVIGVWGETCRFGVAAPAILPNLAFHAFIRNPNHVSYNAKIKIKIPGKTPPIELVAPMPGDLTQDSQFLNININGIQIPESGSVVAHLELDLNPPVIREFSMRIDFVPGAKPPAPLGKFVISPSAPR